MKEERLINIKKQSEVAEDLIEVLIKKHKLTIDEQIWVIENLFGSLKDIRMEDFRAHKIKFHIMNRLKKLKKKDL